MSQEHTRSPGTPASAGRPGRAAVVAVALAALAVGLLLGYSLAISRSRDVAAELTKAREQLDALTNAHESLNERNWTLYLEVERLRSAEETVAPETQPGVFGDGTYEVGTDIEPGTYRGEPTGEFGYWARLSATTGMLSAIIANDIERGPFVLTINPADAAVELRGVTLTASE